MSRGRLTGVRCRVLGARGIKKGAFQNTVLKPCFSSMNRPGLSMSKIYSRRRLLARGTGESWLWLLTPWAVLPPS